MEPSPIVCFECAQSVGDPPVMNTLPDGRNCQMCSDRVLAAQPGIFHERWEETVEDEAPILPGPGSRDAMSNLDGNDPEPA